MNDHPITRKPDVLDDLIEVFADVRTMAGGMEERPGVFDSSGPPFLHFHVRAGGRRRADVKGRTNGVQLEQGAVNASVTS
jgi:hypothetical protein